ncbi:MAG: amidohydrolase family protein [Planctomycetota bacterium]
MDRTYLLSSWAYVHPLSRWMFGLLLLLGGGATLRAGEPSNEPRPLVLGPVTVIDVLPGHAVPDQGILIEGDRITAVAPMDELVIPPSAQRVDTTGQFAIPGLWDMHVHWYAQDTMKLFPINGVTGVRVMWGNFMHHAWRKAFEKGERLGPRMLIASAIIDGPQPIWPGSIVAADAEGGRKAVAQAIRSQSDFAKVYSLLPREAYFAIAEEANAQQLPFDGHVPMLVSPREAAEAGHRCMEHMYELLLACSSEEDSLREMQLKLVEAEGRVAALRNSDVRRDVAKRALDTYDEQKAQELFSVFVQHDTWHCPTLTVLRNLAHLSEPEVRDNPNLRYLPASMLNYLAPNADRFGTEAARKFNQLTLQAKYRVLAQMQAAGVRLLAGTDVLNPYCLPGFSLHGELALLVDKVGLTPAEALRTATIHPAIFQGREAELGSIEPGKLADLVLLTQNPLEDIRATNRINSVIMAGHRYTRAELDGMLEELEAANREDQ